MHIRTAEEMARALDSPLDLELKQLLQNIADRLAEYPDFTFEELVEVAIVRAGSGPDDITSTSGISVFSAGEAGFAVPVELIVRHRHWIEATFVLSDDGLGLVLLVEIADATDKTLLALCTRELERYSPAAS